MIYFDNAATTLQKPSCVIDAVSVAMKTFGGVGRGVHGPALEASMCVFEARELLANLFNAKAAHQVAFTSNATEALNIAIEGLLGPGDHAITTAASHNSVLRPLYRKQREGAELSIAEINPDGTLDLEAFKALFRKNTKLVVATHASNLTGTVYDIATMAEIAKQHEALFVVDAAQTAGLIPLDMQRCPLDIIAFTGHKSLFGPQGTGGLCVSDDIAVPPYSVGGSGSQSFDHKHPDNMPESLEAGTLNAHGIAGLAAGVSYISQKDPQSLLATTQDLTRRFIDGVSSIEGITLYGHSSEQPHCGIVALNYADIDSAIISDYLFRDYEICTRSGAHCAPLMHEALGTKYQGAVRFSFSHFNTNEEIDSAVQALCDIVHHITTSH